MPTTQVLVALLALAGGSVASPTKLQKRTFSVNQPDRPVDFEDGALALRRAYLKHGIETDHLPPLRHTASRSMDKRQAPAGAAPVGPAPTAPPATPGNQTASTIAMSDANDLEYLAPVEIGGTMLRMNFDTGSSDLWVFSDKTPEFQRYGHAYYITNNNGSAQHRQTTGVEKPGYSWRITYGDGSGASGVVYADKVKIGPVTATSQAIEAATSVSSQFMNEHADGLMGLGFGKTNTIIPQRQPTFFENIKSSLEKPLFTASLKKNATGTYDFGFIDEKKYTGPIQYVPINTTRGYWEYQASGYQIGKNPPVALKYQSIADTGTTLMLLPPRACKEFYAEVKGAALVPKEGGYVFPCNATLPDITVMMGDVKATVPSTFLSRGLSMTGSGKCFGGIQQGSELLSIWGDIFLKSQFVVFDGQEPPRIGFARQSISVVNEHGANPHLIAPPKTGSGKLASRSPAAML